MKILLWSPKGAGLHYGGPGMNAYRLFQAKVDQSFSVDLAHGNSDQASYELFRAQYYVAPFPRPKFWDQLRFLRGSKQWLKQHAEEYDVLFGLTGYNMTVLPADWAEKRSLPSVVKIATHKEELVGGTISNVFGVIKRRHRILNRISAVVAMTQKIYDECRRCGIDENRIARIPNGVDTNLFRPVENRERKQELRKQLGLLDIPTIIFTGGVSYRKRPHFLVEALQYLADRGQQWQLVILGPVQFADYGKTLKSMIHDSNARHRIHQFPFMENVTPYLQAADVFALPSKKEGMPNAGLEAIASGLPAIMSDISGASELIGNNEAGFQCEANSQSFATAIANYGEDEQLLSQHSQQARKTAVHEFDTSLVLNKYLDLFQRILDGASPN